MKEEAKKFEEEDKKRAEEIQIKNNADSLAYETEKVLSEHGDKVSPEIKTKVEGALKELKDALGGDDIEQIKTKTEGLGKVVQEVGASIYQQAQAEQAAQQQAQHQAGEKTGEEKKEEGEKVVDAEYTVEDEEKKN